MRQKGEEEIARDRQRDSFANVFNYKLQYDDSHPTMCAISHHALNQSRGDMIYCGLLIVD